MTDQFLEPLMQMGVAGLMGILWVWERTTTRRREQQLTDAHDRLLSQREHLEVVVRLVQRNTHAIDRFAKTQDRLCRLLEALTRDRAQPPGGE